MSIEQCRPLEQNEYPFYCIFSLRLKYQNHSSNEYAWGTGIRMGKRLIVTAGHNGHHLEYGKTIECQLYPGGDGSRFSSYTITNPYFRFDKNNNYLRDVSQGKPPLAKYDYSFLILPPDSFEGVEELEKYSLGLKYYSLSNVEHLQELENKEVYVIGSPYTSDGALNIYKVKINVLPQEPIVYHYDNRVRGVNGGPYLSCEEKDNGEYPWYVIGIHIGNRRNDPREYARLMTSDLKDEILHYIHI